MSNKYLKNYSPSSVNSFIEYRTRFYLEKIIGLAQPSNLNMELGKAVEAGITSALVSDDPIGNMQKAIDMALNGWDKATPLLGTAEEREEMRVNIPRLIEAGIPALQKYGKLINKQRRIYDTVEGVSLPWVGFVDLDFENDVIVDLKVTSRTPSSLSGAHARQGAFYHYHTPSNKKVIMMYLVPLKNKINIVELSLDNAIVHYNHLVAAAKTMDRLLAIDDNKLLEDIFFPNLGCYTMQDEEFGKNVKDIWFND